MKPIDNKFDTFSEDGLKEYVKSLENQLNKHMLSATTHKDSDKATDPLFPEGQDTGLLKERIVELENKLNSQFIHIATEERPVKSSRLFIKNRLKCLIAEAAEMLDTPDDYYLMSAIERSVDLIRQDFTEKTFDGTADDVVTNRPTPGTAEELYEWPCQQLHMGGLISRPYSNMAWHGKCRHPECKHTRPCER